MNNKLLKHFLIIILCYILDSTISYLLPYNFTKQSLTIIPYFGLVAFIKSTDYFEDADLYFFAAICSTYYSIVYANSLFIYICIYEVIAFSRKYIFKIQNISLFEFERLSVSWVITNIFVTYIVMLISQKTNINLLNLLLYRILPNIVLTIIISIIIYKLFEKLEKIKFIEPLDNTFTHI